MENIERRAIRDRDRKDPIDAAARVKVVFGKESFWGTFEGTEPSGMKIEYIWGNRLPKEKVFDHPGEKNTKVVVLESGMERPGNGWMNPGISERTTKTSLEPILVR